MVDVDVNMSELMEDGEDSSMPESVEVSEGEGSYQEDENVSRMGTDPEEDSSVEQQIAGGEKLSEREDPAIQNPEVKHSKGILVPEDDEASRLRDADEPVQEAFGSALVSNNGDHPESVSSDELSPKVDEGPTVEEKEILESGSEDKQVLPEIADGLSQPPDTGTEDLDSVDLSDMLDPKPIAFEVIDFDEFGPQPPDLPLSDSLNNEEVEMMVNQYGGIDSPDGERGAGESTEVMKPEAQITDIIIDNSDNGVEQEMKTLNDDPAKDASEREQLQKERDPDMDSYRIVPNRIKELQSEDNLPSLSFRGAEDDEGLEVPNSKPAAERNGMEVEGPSGSEEIQKLAEELNQLTREQARQLEDIRHQAELPTAQLEEQSKIHELKRELEAEYDERLKSEAKLMVLNEMLPNMEEKLKNLSNQVLSLEVLLQEQVDLRNKLLEDLQQESKERMQYVTQLEEQIDLKNKLAETLEQERTEKMQYIAQLEEQTRLHEELVHKLDEERDERLKNETDLAVLREILSNTEEKLSNTEEKLSNTEEKLSDAEEKLSNTEKKLANAEDKLFNAEEKLSNAEEELKDLRDQVESLAAQLQEQTELRKGLEEKLDWESKERMQHMTKLEEPTKIHEELALKLEEERDERLKSDTNLEELRESLFTKEEELNALQNQVVSLTTQVQEQFELKKELEDKLDQERIERMQAAVMVSDHSSESLPVSSMPWSEEKLEMAKLLDEQKALLANQVLEAEKLKDAAQMKVGVLNDQVQNLEALTDMAETMEHVFNAKERAIKQALWTVFQAVCLGMGLMYFVVAYKDPLRSSLQPT